MTNDLYKVIKSSTKLAKEMRSQCVTEMHVMYRILYSCVDLSGEEDIDDLEDLELIRKVESSTIDDEDLRSLRFSIVSTFSSPPLEDGEEPGIGPVLKFLEEVDEFGSSVGYGDSDPYLFLTVCASHYQELFGVFGLSKENLMESQRFNRIPKSKFSGEAFEGQDPEMPTKKRRKSKKDSLEALNQYAVCLNDKATAGKFDPVIGREREVEKLSEILCCRKKNNAVILGEPGTGKSSLVEGLVQKISEGKVPKYLLGKKIYSLNLNSMVAGSIYRGQFEERLQGIIDEVIAHPEIIVFIDEIHNVVGSGSSSGSGDAANILKPYLARGEFQCIGATTVDEYRKIIEKDGALKRRFQEVHIDEPSKEETVEILMNIRQAYQDFHGVSYSEEVIKRVVDLADRYINDRFFPDKAIDILDLIGSRMKLSKATNFSKIEELQGRLKEIREKKMQAVSEQDFEKAAALKGEEDIISAELDSELSTAPSEKIEITMDTVDDVVSGKTGIPVEKLGKTDMQRLRVLRENLGKKVIGQEEAVTEVTRSIQKDLLGLKDQGRPTSLLLIGTTGVGKTLIAKEIADIMYGKDNFVRLDCSEYTDRYNVQKLLGSDPGTIGFDSYKSPLLKLKYHPRSVLLVDEVDKAATEVINSLFLPILDEGEIRLSDGTLINFRECLILFTGNVGTKEVAARGNGLGFGAGENRKKFSRDIIMKAVEHDFRPEFINRLSGTIVFNELGRAELERIYSLELDKLNTRLSKAGLILEVSDGVKEKILESVNLKYGARDLSRKITEYIENPVCEKMISDAGMEELGERAVEVTIGDNNQEIEVIFK